MSATLYNFSDLSYARWYHKYFLASFHLKIITSLTLPGRALHSLHWCDQYLAQHRDPTLSSCCWRWKDGKWEVHLSAKLRCELRVESSGDPSLNREAGSKLIFATTRSSAAAAVSSQVGEISHINLIYLTRKGPCPCKSSVDIYFVPRRYIENGVDIIHCRYHSNKYFYHK